MAKHYMLFHYGDDFYVDFIGGEKIFATRSHLMGCHTEPISMGRVDALAKFMLVELQPLGVRHLLNDNAQIITQTVIWLSNIFGDNFASQRIESLGVATKRNQQGYDPGTWVTLTLNTGRYIMPWKKVEPMDQKILLIAKWLREESVTDLANELGASRKTIYKWIERYTQAGLDGLKDRSRAPANQPNQTPPVADAQVGRQNSGECRFDRKSKAKP